MSDTAHRLGNWDISVALRVSCTCPGKCTWTQEGEPQPFLFFPVCFLQSAPLYSRGVGLVSWVIDLTQSQWRPSRFLSRSRARWKQSIFQAIVPCCTSTKLRFKCLLKDCLWIALSGKKKCNNKIKWQQPVHFNFEICFDRLPGTDSQPSTLEGLIHTAYCYVFQAKIPVCFRYGNSAENSTVYRKHSENMGKHDRAQRGIV